MSEVRTRFAPSPTGILHLGSARTALFNWAYARHHEGHFVLRIEDTDRERSTPESEASLLRGLEWMEIDWDEGPFRQSERGERHRAVVESLIEQGHAYRCVCSREELDARKVEGGNRVYDGRCRQAHHGSDCGPHVVRLRVDPDQRLGWCDLVYGSVGQDAIEIGDAIIRRTDGTPLYNLAVVVDDIDLRITHVIRGAEHQSNTPLQLALYRALEVEPPVFAHVPLIVGPSGKKLSKRRDPVSIERYRDEGYLREAMRNWLIRVGWSHGDQEIFSQQEIVDFFDLDAVGHSGAQADPDKLSWLNQHYIKELAMDDLFERVAPFIGAKAGAPVERTSGLEALLDLLRERSKTLDEMAGRALWFVSDTVELDEQAVKKHLRPAALELMESLHERMSALEDWTEAALETAFEQVAAEHDNAKLGKLAQPVRVAVTGGPVSPGIYETLAALGRERSLQRLASAIELTRERARSAPA